MKSKVVFSTFLMFLCGQFLFAQYGNGYGGYGNGYGNGYGGSGRMRGMQQDMGQSQPSKPKEVPTEETVAKIMETLTPELGLDGLQEVAISNVLIESINAQGVLMKNESLSQDAKMEEYKSLSEKTNKQINAYLSPDQQEKYKVYLEDSKKNKKPKRKKKE